MELGDDQNDAVSSPPSTVTLTSLSLSDSSTADIHHAPPPQPIFPIEIVEEIIIRFPVKFLSQLRCVCKSWNTLISDPKFARRHLRRFNRRILLVHFFQRFKNHSHESYIVSYPLPSVLPPVTTGGTQIDSLLDYLIIGSCDGIICCRNFSHELGYSFVVWNPSIRKFWELPLLEEDCDAQTFNFYGFGYDHRSDSFKVVVIFYCDYKNHVMVHTLGSNSWRRIQDFPGIPCIAGRGCRSTAGKFVSGAVNWLTRDADFNRTQSIISLDLGKESFQEFLQPDYGIRVRMLTMDVMRDCLCLLANSDVWVMKEYGNSESWTKLFSFPSDSWRPRCPYHLVRDSLCVLDDDESLFYRFSHLDIYNYKSGTFRRSDLEYKDGLIKDTHANVQIRDMYVEIESLISPLPQN